MYDTKDITGQEKILILKNKLRNMPIYMDAHILPNVTAEDVAIAHKSDLSHQDKFGCNCLTYWFDPNKNAAFCLIEAPDIEAVNKLHHKSHGLIPHKIIEVSSSIVESFLGRIKDPDDTVISNNGLRIFSDPPFRFLLITQINDPILLQHQLGIEKANKLVSHCNAMVRKNIMAHEGREAEHSRDGLIASFTKATKAFSCALAIQKDMDPQKSGLLKFRMCIHGGEPVESSNKLFGESIQFANYLCTISDQYRIAISSKVKELLVSNELYQNNKDHLLNLSPKDESFLKSFFLLLEEQWKEPDFSIKAYCKFLAMSQSQAYRKITSLTGSSFNTFLKEYRLLKSKELMKNQLYSISQITFNSGFSSPSYFTKCFKNKFGLLPRDYVELVH